jgi:DNA-directed RNA polymerase sigma subunit (sigma70/sigma32)
MLTDEELWENMGRVLDDRSRRIVEMRAQGHKLQEIADEFSVSQTRIRQLYKIALERLRGCLKDWSDINLQEGACKESCVRNAVWVEPLTRFQQ